MPDLLAGETGERMELDVYYAEFGELFWRISDLGFWKLERGQTFREPGYDSWEAFAAGDWARSMRILEAGRADMAAYHRRAAERGFTANRVRVVEEPISPYLQWELHALRIRDQSGGPVRVLGPEQVAEFETARPLPEVYTLGAEVMYEAVYDGRGVLESVRRFADPALILRCRQFIVDLYGRGEPLESYFAREVAELPAPPGQRA
ncbi:DUF6879 family protein [Kitasatospora viridis]|uniref:DUF6879 domain-containing protein n=1 Tax=Kitasatospora viridis TaxID=281105 RepID=A0A561SF33_9ACTN|nr:DUF6879 family protein [Kitasatospora viridis]TWF73417.1 hypothetical protein FHX73_1528 [Kitasatospora viridis]